MGEYTENLNLFKYDVVEDGKRPFSIEQALNDNWDKIDQTYKYFLNKDQIIKDIQDAILTKANTTDIDGNWTLIYKQILSNVTIQPNGYIEIDLTPILPQDGYTYEIIFTAIGEIKTGSNVTARLSAYSNLTSYIHLAEVRRLSNTLSGEWVAMGGNAIIPIPPNRKFFVRESANSARIDSIYGDIVAYRKVR